MAQRLNTIQDYKAFLARRRYRILVPFLIVFGLAAVVAFLLPSVYRSSSTIVIETQQVPQELIRSTVTSYVEERLKIISQGIMSRGNLQSIMERFGIYRELKDNTTTEEIIAKMREDISLETVSAETMDRRTGRATPVTVAFTLSFEGKDPGKVQNVANALASLYLEENLKTRTSMAETTASFLEKQAEEYRKQCADLEQKIAGFKERHMGELPEQLQLNLQTENQMRTQMDVLDRDIRSLQDVKFGLEGQLATVKPDSSLIDETGQRVLDVRERLKLKKSQLVSLTATFSEKHPDVIRLKKEVADLDQEQRQKDDLPRKRKELADKKAKLEQLMGRVTDKHPDAVKLRGEIAQAEEDLEKAGKQSGGSSGSTVEDGDNPQYIHLKTQISSSAAQLTSLKKQRADLHNRWTSYVRRLENAPRAERGYLEMARDYDNARSKYRETVDKLMQAKQALTLEENQAGEKFTIVEPAQFPERPAKPNRLAICLIGLILGLGAGVGYASILEFSDTSVRNAEDLQALTHLPVLAVIPRIFTEEDLAGKGRSKWIYVAIAAGLIVVAALIVHFAVMDLEVLWVKVLRRM